MNNNEFLGPVMALGMFGYFLSGICIGAYVMHRIDKFKEQGETTESTND